MNKQLFSLIIVSVLTSAMSVPVQAQSGNAADTVVIYVVPETEEGFSAKKTFLGKAVYNENKQKVGTITDLLVAPDTSVAFVVIGAGGFVGLGKHNVAVRTSDLRVDDGKFVLPGATKQSLKAAPKLEYPKRGRS
jgi:sporulation protein YlmC with PRC-barrel domain